MSNRTMQDMAWLATGALAGAAAIFLLDPERGARRRQRIGAFYDESRHLVEQGLTRGQTTARQVQRGASQTLGEAARQAQDVSSQAYGVTAHLADRAAALLHRGQRDAADRAGSWLQNSAPATRRANALAGACGFMTLGAGLMYFFHPRLGAGRRQWVADAVKGVGRSARATGYGIAQLAWGMTRQARSSAGQYAANAKATVNTGELVSRLREAIASLKAEGVRFLADPDGAVTITGVYARERVQELLEKIGNVPGVGYIINRLEVREEAESPASG